MVSLGEKRVNVRATSLIKSRRTSTIDVLRSIVEEDLDGAFFLGFGTGSVLVWSMSGSAPLTTSLPEVPYDLVRRCSDSVGGGVVTIGGGVTDNFRGSMGSPISRPTASLKCCVCVLVCVCVCACVSVCVCVCVHV